jgi:hypothetical protein
MNPTFAFTLLAILLAPVFALFHWSRAAGERRSRHRRGTLAANIAEGTRDFFSLIPDVTVPARYLLTKPGSDSLHFTLTGAGDRPFGVCEDQSTTEAFPLAGLPFRVGILGVDPRTKKVAIQSSVNALDYLTTDASGFAKSVPAPITGTPATYWVLGMATEAGTASGGSYPTVIEFVPCLPFQLTH